MCGGDINAADGAVFGKCDSCGTTSTLPKANDSKIVNLFNRANHFRRLNEFDKALTAYESILNEDNSNAEAHWGTVLSRYGIEYVEDPNTHERIPTCRRAQFSPVLTDADYLAALQNTSDSYARKLYEDEAKKISEIQKSILAISNGEEPFDVFICYKETTDGGTRTQDSTLAQDIYYQLKDDYKVFFSKITLEDKLGQEYEPYIFSALNSAKVMLVIGTAPEHFNAVWVKNEWSRFLALAKTDRSRLLIPCYRDMDPYDLPEELSTFQSQDMSKIGFMQDLIRGIKKILDAKEQKGSVNDAKDKKDSDKHSNDNADGYIDPKIEKIIKRGYLHLEYEEWQEAYDCFHEVIKEDPEYAPAYLGILMADHQIKRESDIADSFFGRDLEISDDKNYKKVLRFADAEFRKQLESYTNQKKIKEFLCRGHHGDVFSVAYSPDGKYLASGSKDKTIKIWDTAAGKIIRTLEGHTDTVISVAYSPDGKYLASADNTIMIWDTAAGKIIRTLEGRHTDSVFSVAYSPDGKYLASGFKDASRIFKDAGGVRIWDTTTGKDIRTLEGHTDIVRSVAYSPDGKYLASGSDDKTIKIWDTATGKKVRTLRGLTRDTANGKEILLLDGSVGSVTYSPDGNNLACGSSEDICIWDFGENKSELKINEVDKTRSKIMLPKINEFKAYHKLFSAGVMRTYGLRNNGTVVAAGNDQLIETAYPPAAEDKYQKDYKDWVRCDISGWRNITQICGKGFHIVGLKTDGTVVAKGFNYGPEGNSRCDVSGWKDIIFISAGKHYTLGLRSDGTVISTGKMLSGPDKGFKKSEYTDCGVSEWRDITEICACDYFCAGLKSDGTVVVSGKMYINDDIIELDVSKWKDIAVIRAGIGHLIGLRTDGTVVATGLNLNGACDVSEWKDIVAVDGGVGFTIGIKLDGTAVTAGSPQYDESNVLGWKNIKAISIGFTKIVGIVDGSVIAIGENRFDDCNVSDWDDIGFF
jgi:tetratricopeptide (TPR) repeat protein